MKPKRYALDLLRKAMATNNSLVCCGLDPDIKKIPMELREEMLEEEAILEFLKIIVDLTAPYVCAYKAQKAFFDVWPNGHELLRKTISYIHEHHPKIPVFVDAKIGDIGNTMEIYIRNIFGELKADGVVVNPYLGDDVMMPFASWPEKAIIVTVKTSNPKGALVQDVLLHDGKRMWEYLLDLTVNRWNTAGNMIPVISSTTDSDLDHVRRALPDEMPVFFAGYGAQGGTTEHLRQLLDSSGRGAVVNSSRGLLYPYEATSREWRSAVSVAVQEMQRTLNFERSRSKFLLLLGVSAVGKSTLIKELQKLDDRFVYISPFMTRALRDCEVDKVSVTDVEMDEMEKRGELVFVNKLYNGVRYGTPRKPIEEAFLREEFPVLDWPVELVPLMEEVFAGRLFTVYVEPEDVSMLQFRLNDGRDPSGERYLAALAELEKVRSGFYDDRIQAREVNIQNQAATLALGIYRSYIKATGL